MARRVSEETKEKTRGFGRYDRWRPWVTCAEVPSTGTTSEIPDWKHGRSVQLLSTGERWAYLINRWDDRVDDINEQFPLPLDATNEIARILHYKPVNNGRTHVTTDLLIWYLDGTQKAYSVKADKSATHPEMRAAAKDQDDVYRTLEKLAIERYYWEQIKGVKWELIYRTELNGIFAENIAAVCKFYNINDVFDKPSLAMHLAATKKLKIDMTKEEINFVNVAANLNWSDYDR